MSDTTDLKKFYSHIKQKDLARKHLWTINITEDDVKEDMILYGVSTSWPSKAINPVEVPYLGFTYKVPGVAKFDETWKVTVRDSADFRLRKKLSGWLDAIYNPETGEADYIGKAFKDGTLFALNPDLSASVEIIMEGMFPTSIGTIDYDYASDGEVITYDVEFAYQRWTIKD